MENKTKYFKKISIIFYIIILSSLTFALNNNISVNRPVYIAPYIGDIDGGTTAERFTFYNKLANFHDGNKIKVGISLYPGIMSDNLEYKKSILLMYNSPYIELIQKGYKGNPIEYRMNQLTYKEQRNLIKRGQNAFIDKMKKYGVTNPKIPKTYNQLSGRINEDTIRALKSLGFNSYFDVYYDENLYPLDSTKEIDIMQYGVSFTKTGHAGGEEEFDNENDVIRKINNFYRSDLTVMKINGKQVIPMWVHQQDFEDVKNHGVYDKKKWEIYSNTYMRLKNDPNVTFITASEVHDIRH